MADIDNKLISLANLKTFYEEFWNKCKGTFQRIVVSGDLPDSGGSSSSSTGNVKVSFDPNSTYTYLGNIRGTDLNGGRSDEPTDDDTTTPNIVSPNKDFSIIDGFLTFDGTTSSFTNSSATKFQFNNINTSKTVSFANMFSGCSNLKQLDIDCFDTSSATTMNNMFSGCPKLKSIDVLGFNTASTESMASMFAGDTALESIDLTSFDLRKVTDLSGMFRGCTSLKEIVFGNGFKNGFDHIRFNSIYNGNLTPAMDCRSMFRGCTGLTSIDLSYIDPAGIFVNLDNIESSEIFDKEYFKENIYFKFIHGLKYDPTGSNEWFAIDSTDFYNKYIINIGMQDMFDGCTNLNNIITGKVGGTYEFHFGHTPWQIQQQDSPYKPVFTICDLSSCHLDNTTLTYHLFDINRLGYDGSKKSLFGIILDDDNFDFVANHGIFDSREWFQSNGGRVYFDGYTIIKKSFYESSQTSLASEITVDDGRDGE